MSRPKELLYSMWFGNEPSVVDIATRHGAFQAPSLDRLGKPST